MPVEAKIAANTAGINVAPVQTIAGPIAVAPGGSVALNVAPEAVAGYAREGTDLLVHLKSGEVVRLANFYVDPSKASHLLLVSEDQLVAAEVGNVGAGAMSSATYVPIDATAGFSTPAATTAAADGADAAGAAAGAGAGGLGAGTLIPLAALGAAGLVAAAASGGGGDDDEPSPPAPTPPDTTAPGAATNLAIAAAGDRLTGSAEAGATVRVDVDGNGSSDYTATVGANGTFAIALSPPLVNGQVVRVTVADTAGNVGAAATVAAPDTTMPAPAASVAIAANGTGLTGIGEAGSTVTVNVDRDGDVDYTATIGADGTFSISFATPIDNGQEIDVTITDPAGNDSTPITITAPDLSPAPATAPILDPTNGTVVSGTAQSGVAVVLSDAAGNTIGQATIDAARAWSFTPATPLPDGTVVQAVAVNALGEAGPATTVTVDAVAPATPEIEPSNGSLLTGSAEAGATVVLLGSSGDVLGQVTAGADGTWSFAPATALEDGVVVNALVRDAAGNESAQASVTIDAVAPFVPTINLPSGAAVSGTAEPGSTVVLTNADGAVLAEVTAGGTGVWAFAPATPFADGTVINAVVRDAAGNTSPPATATVDASAPATPTVAASNGEVLSGTAEVGSTVILTDGGGNPIAQVVADGDGEWTFTPSLPLPEGTIVLVTARDTVGNTSAGATTTVDRTPPAAPEITPSNGAVVSGTADAGAIVTVTDGNGTPLGQTIADGDGNWSILPASALPDGTVVIAVAADPAGNVGLQSSITIDAIAPLLPTIDPTDGTEITGVAEAGTRVIVTDADGEILGEVTADGSGSWSVVLPAPLPDGTALIVTAVDPSGNTSPPATATVDASAPATPTVAASNGEVLSGTAEVGSTVILTDGGGNPIAQVVADGDGEWTFTPSLPLPEGTIVLVTARDAVGNTSAGATTTIDRTPPAAPEITPSNGVVVSGTAEAGAIVTVTDGNGTPLGQTIADGDGNWSILPASALPDGTVVIAVAADPAGNVGLQSSITIDAIAPLLPTIDPTDGTEITGVAEAGTRVIVTDADGDILGEVTADGSGSWSVVPPAPLPDGTALIVTAVDPSGNTSPPATATVDASAPATPTVAASNGEVLSGTAEVGSTVILADGGGNPIAQVVADGDGEWTFTPSLPLPEGTIVLVTARDAVGNTSAGATTTIDRTPPAAPEITPSNGVVVSGTAEAGAIVTVTDGNGTQLGQTIADGDGNWSILPASALPDGTVVIAVAADPAGNVGLQSSITIDAIAPLLPTIDPTDGTEITGVAEAGTRVIVTDADGEILGEVTADGSGSWSVVLPAPLPDGTALIVTAVDPSGNTSPPATATVDASAPATPTVAASNGEVLSGTAEVGSTVILTDGGGNLIAQVVADGDGEWAFTPSLPLPEGTIVLVTARDAVGNTSAGATTTIDRTPPAAPEITPSNGVVVSGTAEAGAIVTVTDGNGTPLGQTIADGDGNWSILPASALPDGTVVIAVAADPAGNVGLQSSITIDAIAPLLPTIDPTDGTEITGVAEAGTRVIVTDADGEILGEVTADGSGSWSVVLPAPLPDGTALIVTAVDPSGNTSPPATATVDAVAPVQPTIGPTNGSVIIGRAEPNSTVILLDGTGGPQQPGVQIGEVTADGNGDWSFGPLLPLPDGTVVIAVSVDAAGNASPPVNTTVDGTPPPIPTVEPTNGIVLTGTAEANATILLTDSLGDTIGETVANDDGDWTFEPLVPLLDGQLVNVTAVDAAGNPSIATSTVVDAVIPPSPVIAPSNGDVLTGTAEPNSVVILSTTAGGILAEITVDPNGDWSFNPPAPLLNGTVVFAVAEDAAGNTSPPAFTAVDAIPPVLLSAQLSPDGAVLSGFAEPNSALSVVINGDTANAIPVTVSGQGMYMLPFSPPLVANEVISVTAVDLAGNQSIPINLIAPDIAPPTVAVFEAADGWINAVEAADGIEVEVFLRPTMQVGQVITVRFEGANGYEAVASHVLDATDLQVGSTTVAIEAVNGQGPLPDGVASITASVGAGGPSTPTVFTVDTTPPATPVLSLASSLLSISGADPGSELTVNVDLGGVSASAVVTADGGGLASLNLLTDLDLDLGWDQLLTAQVSVVGEDPAGNTGNVATLSILPSLEQPVTIGNFAVEANLNLLNPLLGVTGTTDPNATVAIRVLSPLLDVTLAPIAADDAGNFELNLLSPDVLNQLGLDVIDVLGLGAQLSLQLVAIDSQDRVSATYGVDLAPDGLSLAIGQIDVNGTTADDILSGLAGSAERINSGSGNDLVLDVATGDRVFASDANDTIEIEAGDFVSIEGGLGFDTLLLSSGIDLDYNAPGVGTLTNIERIDLGVGDGGSTLILTAAEVDAITDNGNTLQITGETNDLLSIAGAVDTGATELQDGIVFNVYTFGVTNVLVEENTVQVAV